MADRNEDLLQLLKILKQTT